MRYYMYVDNSEKIINTAIAGLCKKCTPAQSKKNPDGCPRRLKDGTIPHCYAGEEGRRKYGDMVDNAVSNLPEGPAGDEMANQMDQLLKNVKIR